MPIAILAQLLLWLWLLTKYLYQEAIFTLTFKPCPYFPEPSVPWWDWLLYYFKTFFRRIMIRNAITCVVSIWHHVSKSKANLTSKVQGKEGIGESIILPDSTLQRLGFLSLIPANLNSVPMFLASHLSLFSPLVYFLLTFKLSQKLLVHPHKSLHYLQRWGPVKHLPILDPWLSVSGSHYQCNPETCCMVCALLCCPPIDTEVIQVSSEKSMACKCENLSSCLKEASSTSSWSGGL